jgi:hypothetical protein
MPEYRIATSSTKAASGRAGLVVRAAFELPERSLMTTSITASTVEAFLAEMDQATTTGVDVIELRLDFIMDFDTERDLLRIMRHSKLPYIVTYRPKWEWCVVEFLSLMSVVERSWVDALVCTVEPCKVVIKP